MANILDRYGIKEVADVTFYELDTSGNPTAPVLYLDTLKVSTIEQTAEQSTANGGKGNAPLIVWDYGKEINVTLEDALFSPKSLAIMFGDGEVKSVAAASGSSKYVMKTEALVCTSAGTSAASCLGYSSTYTAPDGKGYSKLNPKYYDAKGASTSSFVKGETYFCSYDLAITNESVIEVSANTFPGTYYVTGDTYARNDASGQDEFFQFIIPKAKVLSENTITMEADGDPSVFNMSLKVLRPRDGVMMKLVKYSLTGGTTNTANDSTSIFHNHDLKPATT